MKLSWPTMPNVSRAYSAIQYMLAQDAMQAKAVYRLEVEGCSNSVLPESPAGGPAAAIRYRLGNAFKEFSEWAPEHFVFATSEPGDDRFRIIAWFMLEEEELSMHTIKNSFIAKIKSQFFVKDGYEPIVAQVAFAGWPHDQVVKEAEQMKIGVISATHRVCLGAAQQAYIETSNGAPLDVKPRKRRVGKINPAAVEPIHDQAMAAAGKEIREESPKELLVESMMLFGRGMRIATRQLISKAREQMTARASLRKI